MKTLKRSLLTSPVDSNFFFFRSSHAPSGQKKQVIPEPRYKAQFAASCRKRGYFFLFYLAERRTLERSCHIIPQSSETLHVHHTRACIGCPISAFLTSFCPFFLSSGFTHVLGSRYVVNQVEVALISVSFYTSLSHSNQLSASGMGRYAHNAVFSGIELTTS